MKNLRHLMLLKNHILSKNTKSLSIVRSLHNETEKNVVKSPYQTVPLPLTTIPEYIWENIEKHAGKTAVLCGLTGRSYTYEQAFKMTNSFAASLRSKLRVKDGDCIAVVMPNMPEFPVATLGVLQAGGVLTTVNSTYTADEMKRQLEAADAKIIITSEHLYPTVKNAADMTQKNLPIIVASDSNRSIPEGAIRFSEWAEDFNIDKSCLGEMRRTCEDLALLPFSSGTTGAPKGVELTHRSIVINSNQKLHTWTDLANAAMRGPDDQESVNCLIPMFHIYGFTGCMINKMFLGAKIVTLPKFQPETFVASLYKHRCSLLMAVPPIVHFLGAHPSVKPEYIASLKLINSGAAPLTQEAHRHFLEKFQDKVGIIQGYGLTETSPLLCVQEVGDTNFDSVGRPVSNTEMKVVSLDTNEALGPDQCGELWVRGPQVMRGYHNNPSANQDVFSDGWLRTGDIVKYNKEGEFFVTDRLKELIKVKGFQVPPAELEGVLSEHPSVLEAAVVGIPHSVSGEVPKAYVVTKNKKEGLEDELIKFVAQKVSAHKKIVKVEFIESLPRNAAGKIMRLQLKQANSI